MTARREFFASPAPETAKRKDEPMGICAGEIDDWTWFDHSEDALEAARAICNTPCPIKAECLAYAIKHKLEGNWAGTSDDIRKHGGTCGKGHDLSLPRSTVMRGACRLCKNDRDRRNRAKKSEQVTS